MGITDGWVGARVIRRLARTVGDLTA